MKKKISIINISLATDAMKTHRYKSIDDWFNPVIHRNEIYFTTMTADTGNMDYNFLVLIHALIEQYLCYKNGISDEEVSTFDMEHTHCDDPGSHKEAPYYLAHMNAEEIERLMAINLHIDWNTYSDAIDTTLATYTKK